MILGPFGAAPPGKGAFVMGAGAVLAGRSVVEGLLGVVGVLCRGCMVLLQAVSQAASSRILNRCK